MFHIDEEGRNCISYLLGPFHTIDIKQTFSQFKNRNQLLWNPVWGYHPFYQFGHINPACIRALNNISTINAKN
jgi:hypothetical protein